MTETQTARAPQPASQHPPALGADEVARFHRDGFLVRERLIDEPALASLRRAYDELLAGVVPAPFDRQLGGLTRQVMHPSFSHPVFEANGALEAGFAIARALYPERPHVVRTFDMLIYKPPGHPHPTPWHQDFAYAYPPVTQAGTPIPDGSIQFWVALDDTDRENGCMHFLPGWHRRPLLPHLVASGDPQEDSRLLEIDTPVPGLDPEQGVACPLRAGGCTLHSYGTPHYTPPNRSADRPRRAYIFNLLAGGSEALDLARLVREHLRAVAQRRSPDGDAACE